MYVIIPFRCMKRRLLILLSFVLLGLVFWLYISASKIFKAKADVQQKYQAVITAYIDMGPAYIDPLRNIHDLSRSDQDELKSISDHLKEFAQQKDMKKQYDLLLSFQHEIISFFASSGKGDSLTSDPHYLEWNTNASNRGNVSLIIQEYDQALSNYNGLTTGVVGHFLDQRSHWEYNNYLSVNGTTQVETKIHF